MAMDLFSLASPLHGLLQCTPNRHACTLLQVQALAQSTIQDLHNKLAAKSAEVEDGKRRLQATRNMAANEVDDLQEQIEQLSQQLQLQDQRHVKVSPANCIVLRVWSCCEGQVPYSTNS